MLWAPIQLIEEGSDGLASRRHGPARRLESRQPDGAQPVAATRLCGAPPRGRAPASEGAGRPHPAADGPCARGVHPARRPTAGRLAESGAFLWCRRERHAPHPGRSRPSSPREQTGRGCALCVNR